MRTPLLGVESVHLGEQLIEGLLPLVVPAGDRADAARLAQGVELVDEDDAGCLLLAWAKRSRTRAAPTPTNISTKSEPLRLKNGTPASPATALASRVLPVPGAPTISTPFGIFPPRRR